MTGVALAATDEELASWRARGVDHCLVDLAGDDYDALPGDFDRVVHTAAAVCCRDFAEGMRANAEAPALLGSLGDHRDDLRRRVQHGADGVAGWANSTGPRAGNHRRLAPGTEQLYWK